MNDEHFQGGDYYESGRGPDVGLAVARMMAHITYVSEESLRAQVRPRPARRGRPRRSAIDFEVESYLHHQGAELPRALRRELATSTSRG